VSRASIWPGCSNRHRIGLDRLWQGPQLAGAAGRHWHAARSHPPEPLGRKGLELGDQVPPHRNSVRRAVVLRSQVSSNLATARIRLLGAGRRHLVRAARKPSSFLPFAVFRWGPVSLGGAQHDHRPRPAARPHRYGGLLADRQGLADASYPSPRPSPGASPRGLMPPDEQGGFQP